MEWDVMIRHRTGVRCFHGNAWHDQMTTTTWTTELSFEEAVKTRDELRKNNPNHAVYIRPHRD